MSGFIFIASDTLLNEVNPTRFLTLTAKDIKQLKHKPVGPMPWEDAPDEAKVIWQINEQTESLQVEYCGSPPYVLDSYTKKPFIYQLGGNLYQQNTIEELYTYIVEKVNEGIPIELWSVWIGNENPNMVRKTVSIDQFATEDIQMIHRPDSCCTIIR